MPKAIAIAIVNYSTGVNALEYSAAGRLKNELYIVSLYIVIYSLFSYAASIAFFSINYFRVQTCVALVKDISESSIVDSSFPIKKYTVN